MRKVFVTLLLSVVSLFAYGSERMGQDTQSRLQSRGYGIANPSQSIEWKIAYIGKERL